jgi:hypothetical protein
MPFIFTPIVNPADPTFNQLLGINDNGVIAGYNGSGAPGHPNQGYTTTTAGTTFNSENFPGSVQTQVVGINNNNATVGFYAPTNNGSDANFGFWNTTPGTFGAVFNPKTTSTPAVNQLLGINDNGVAAGFYNSANGNSHGYTYNLNTGAFTKVVDPAAAAASLTATAIDNAGDVAGFFVNGTGRDSGFLDQNGIFTTIRVPKFGNTQILGLNANGTELVGVAFGNAGFTTGFVYDIGTKQFTLVSDPNGAKGSTFVNGVNDAGQLVGFFTDPATGYTIGMLATPTAAPSVANTGATAQSFDAYSLLSGDAGLPSGSHHETAYVHEALGVAVASIGRHQW